MGPGGDDKAISVGVAAHMTAAASGGPRFNEALSAEERSAGENGIWLCQQCGRLIDTDRTTYNVELLRDWKEFAEKAAFLEVRGYDVVRTRSFARLEEKIPALVAEMRSDLTKKRFTRELIILSKTVMYNYGPKPCFSYYHQEHPELLSKMQILQNYGAITDVTFNDVPRYNFTEDFVDYLLGDSNPAVN